VSLGKIRILHVVDSLDRGGLERVVCDLSIEQMRRGHDVCVYCLHTSGSLAPSLEAAGVLVVCGHKHSGPDLGVVRELKRLMPARAPGLIHSHSMMPNYYACAARLLAGFATPVVNTRHDMGSTRRGDPREKLYRLSVPLTRLAVMVSEGVMEHFVTKGIVPKRKARLVLNGIATDCAQYANPVQRGAARRILAVCDDEFVVGCVGRLVELKNLAVAIRATAHLASILPGVRLVLIGSGPLQPDLEALARELGIEERVSLLGERSDARDLLPGLDAFLMPSLTEGHSIALLEAAAAGLPIVATNVGGNPEIVEHERTGLLVPTNDDTSISRALQRLQGNRTLAAQLGSDARAWVLGHVSVPAMADAYEAVYAEALHLS
jgi:glycosyltransferase involved in cell wall biosynthesis